MLVPHLKELELQELLSDLTAIGAHHHHLWALLAVLGLVVLAATTCVVVLLVLVPVVDATTALHNATTIVVGRTTTLADGFADNLRQQAINRRRTIDNLVDGCLCIGVATASAGACACGSSAGDRVGAGASASASAHSAGGQIHIDGVVAGTRAGYRGKACAAVGGRGTQLLQHVLLVGNVLVECSIQATATTAAAAAAGQAGGQEAQLSILVAILDVDARQTRLLRRRSHRSEQCQCQSPIAKSTIHCGRLSIDDCWPGPEYRRLI